MQADKAELAKLREAYKRADAEYDRTHALAGSVIDAYWNKQITLRELNANSEYQAFQAARTAYNKAYIKLCRKANRFF